ncbi:MAG TPA: hypothetical protein VFW20_07535, partial [Candidatus Limnocylindrales bacterium]|nr:hypothetical protein [Candidatus Limnocylindrales bacterium]
LLAGVGLLDDPEAMAAMRTASRGLGRPGAAAATAELLLALARRAPLPSMDEIARRSAGGGAA